LSFSKKDPIYSPAEFQAFLASSLIVSLVPIIDFLIESKDGSISLIESKEGINDISQFFNDSTSAFAAFCIPSQAFLSFSTIGKLKKKFKRLENQVFKVVPISEFIPNRFKIQSPIHPINSKIGEKNPVVMFIKPAFIFSKKLPSVPKNPVKKSIIAITPVINHPITGIFENSFINPILNPLKNPAKILNFPKKLLIETKALSIHPLKNALTFPKKSIKSFPIEDSFKRVVTPLKLFKTTLKGIRKYSMTPPIPAAIPPVIAPSARPIIANGAKKPPSSLFFSLGLNISLMLHFLKILKILPRVFVCFFSSLSSSLSPPKNEKSFLKVPVVISFIPDAKDLISPIIEFKADPIISVVLD
jgi:hypothetical protein